MHETARAFGVAGAGTLVAVEAVCQGCGVVVTLRHADGGLRAPHHVVGRNFEPCSGSGALWRVVPDAGWVHGPVYEPQGEAVLGWPGRAPESERELRAHARTRLRPRLRDDLQTFRRAASLGVPFADAQVEWHTRLLAELDAAIARSVAMVPDLNESDPPPVEGPGGEPR